MLQKDLQKLGLNDKEAKTYLALLELGESNIQKISKKSGIKRTTVYDVIESLRGRGLLGLTIKNKKIIYFAESPKKLEDNLNNQKAALQNILPELLSVFNLIEKKPKIRFYENEDIKEVYENILNYPDQEVLAWMAEEAHYVLGREFIDLYISKRIDKKIWARVIAPDNQEMIEQKMADEKSLRKTKLVSSEKFPFDAEINLYGQNKIGIVSFQEKIALIIESKKIFITLKSLFEMGWESIK